MKDDREPIKLNDILQLTAEQLENTKIRFMVPNDDINFNPNSDAEDPEKQDLINLEALVYNRKKSISFKEGVIAIGFICVDDDLWLMTGIVRVLHDNDFERPASAEYLTRKFNFRIVVHFHKDFQNGIVRANTVINDLNVIEVWNPDKGVTDNSFPGYKNFHIGYKDLKRKLQVSKEWRTALRSCKGVYLITDKSDGKLYVGSAYGENGILGRWETYIKSGFDRNEVENGKYPNVKFQQLIEEKGITHIQNYFQYSILETFSNDTPDKYIIDRESHWKDVLLSREFGYNKN